MRLVKKCALRSPPSAVASISTNAFFLLDTLTGLHFLIDTGACKSLLPKSKIHSGCSPGTDTHLIAANGSRILTYGYKSLQLSFAGSNYKWDFIVADVSIPIIGADFLANFNLLVDVANRRLVNASTLAATPIAAAPADLALQIADASDTYSSLKSSYPEVFRPVLHLTPRTSADHGVFHHIKTSGPPVFSKFRRLAPDKLQAAKKIFLDMESMGICQKASSPWASPLHIVVKKDGSLRPCGDYRRLNMLTEPDHYPLPNIADVTTYLHGARIFSKLDLLKGYYQIPMHPDDIPKTAITTPFGTYTFNYSCFGLRNAGATFQRMIDTVLGDLPFCVAYVDDILVFSSTPEEHWRHLQLVLERLQTAGLVLRHDKCVFGTKEIDFLGHHISHKGVLPLQEKVAAVRAFPTPTTVKALQEFVGMVNYYHRFLPHIASTMAPLYAALAGKPKTLTWTPAHAAAFDNAKRALSDAAYLKFPTPGLSLVLSTDASDIAIGAVLEQVLHGTKQPLAFFSRKLSLTESRYSTFDRELLAVYAAVRHFRHLVEGSSFTIQTDHLPLVHAFTKKTDPYSARQQRHLSAISEFNCTLQHVPGKKNPVADALSRNSISSVCLGLDYELLARLQQQDPEMPSCRTSLTSLQWKDVPFNDNGGTLLCDISTGRPRPWVPLQLRRQVFNLIHGLAHPSARSTTTLLKKKFIWHSISKDAKAWARSCIPCQQSKVHRHTESGIGSFPQPNRRFSHVHVDIVGPLPPSEGYKYLFTIVDRSTRWPEAVPLADSSAPSCATAFLSAWVSRFGVPEHITSDRGSSFTSLLWTSLNKLLGSTNHHTTAYNPEANGMVERLHRTLKAALIARCTDSSWFHQLPWVLLGLRTTPKEGLDVSAAEMVYGDPLVVPAEFFPATNTPDDLRRLQQIVGKFAPVRTTHRSYRKTYIPKDLSSSEQVFIRTDCHRKPLSAPYTGPYKVLQRRPKTFLLDIRGKHEWTSIDRLKPAFLDDTDPPPVRLSRAGRPLVSSKGGDMYKHTNFISH